jgi:hypothetical protein
MVNNQPNFFKKLQYAFNISFRQNNIGKTGKTQVFPGQRDEETGKMKPVEFIPEIEKLWSWWMKETHDNAATLKNRLDRYADLDYMYYQDGIISRAIETYADEVCQYDSQNKPIIVTAKNKKVENYINDLFDRLNINQQTLRDIARNLVLYGDSFSINSLKDKVGYSSSLVVDVRTIKDRLEFNAVEARKQMANYHQFSTFMARDSRLEMMAKTLQNIRDDVDTTQYYKTFLFGYQVESDLFLAPWEVTHFRLQSSKTEFYPYGRPLLINSLSPFRQLKASKNLMAMARASKFPKDVYKITVDKNMTQAETWQAINEAKNEFMNLSYLEGAREDWAVGGAIWVPKDVVEYDQMQNKMVLGDIADIEMLRDDEIIATAIPRGYLINEGTGWGASGQALLQQYKPFARAVLQVQTAIIRELIQMVKIQLIVSEEFDEDEEFEIAMNFPVTEDAADRTANKSTSLVLAKSIIDNLASALGISSKLPVKVVKDIFTKFTFLNDADIDTWIKEINVENEKLSEDQNKRIEHLEEEIVREAYFKSKKDMRINEGISSGRHFITSFTNPEPTNQFTLHLLKEGKKEKLGKKRL